MANQSVVTSGIYERSLTEAGRVYHHLLIRQPDTHWKLKWPASQLSRMLQWMVRFGQRVYLVIQFQPLEILNQLDGIEGVIITQDQRILYSAG